MGKMFSSMMERFAKGLSEEEKKKMMDCGEKMAGMCSCMNGEEISAEEKKAMKEKMSTCCEGAKEMMSAFFKKEDSHPEEPDKSENS